MAVVSLLLTLSLSTTWAVKSYRAWDLGKRRIRVGEQCRTILKLVFMQERAFFATHARYSEDFREIDAIPFIGNRAACVLSRGGPIEDRTTATRSVVGAVGIIGADEFRFPTVSTKALLARLPAGSPVGVIGKCPACEVVAVCVTDLQILSVATFSRTMPDGGVVPAGIISLDSSEF